VVTQEFLERHPDWLRRYGSRAVERGEEDALYHQDFLAAALEAGSTAAFENYAGWCTGMLESRGIARTFLIENLEQIGEAVRGRVLPEDMEVIEPLLRAGFEAIAAAEHGVRSEPASGPIAEQRLFLQAILSPNRKAAANIVREALRSGCSIHDIYLNIFQKSMYEVGRLWESNQITVAQEHMATAITQSVMAIVYEEIEYTGRPRGKMVITGVEGEMHQIGAYMVADVLEADGWDVVFLGTNTPHSAVLAAVDSHQATVLGISATLLSNVPQVVRLVEIAKKRWGTTAPRIILGGAAFRFAPALSTEIQADGVALDLAEALEVTRPWRSEATN
jgi:methanogenic corrinoid protein MtbC1